MNTESPDVAGMLDAAFLEACADNLNSCFLKILDKLALEVVVVVFKADPGSPVLQHPDIGEELGGELFLAHAGSLDSSFFNNSCHWFFYHVNNRDLARGMAILKAGAESRGLLPVTAILHAESSERLQTWYPPTAKVVINRK